MQSYGNKSNENIYYCYFGSLSSTLQYVSTLALRLQICSNEINTCHLCPQCSHWIKTFLDRHSAFTTFLTSIQTSPLVTQELANGILQWSVQASPQTIATSIHLFPHNIRKCYDKQTHLGWNVATFGLMDTSWSKPTAWQPPVCPHTTNRNWFEKQ
jgi:hypothetical protein